MLLITPVTRQTLRNSNYPRDWRLTCLSFYAYGMILANWMNEHEVLAATVFVAASLALMGLFSLLERRLKRH